MVIPKYTSYEIMQISGVILKAIHEQITNLEKAPNSESLQDYYAGMKDGAKLATSNLKKTLDDLSNASIKKGDNKKDESIN